MQTIIENLNRMGAQAIDFAWPMLWQSTLLIAVVVLVEWALRRRLRAAIRYALWCVVLVKLPEVARLSLRRPLATLGLVGIMESRSFLRQRIERLLEARPVRNPGLTLASGLCLASFAALALPMGQGPERNSGSPS